MTELPKTFDPAAIESRWYSHWEEHGLFAPARPGAEPWTIVNPPPNVTGSLHIGHALDNTLQDILVRHARLKGKDARWVVGMDHAGIATQMVVERQLAERQDKRTNYSREDFIDLVWKWKAESGGQITGQLRRLGCSMDWANERFTMDEGFSKAVLKVFVDLYNQGLIYRDKRLVNWDPALKTAISDLEVESREVQGHMWHFKYPLADGETYRYVERDADGNVVLDEVRDYIAIATTRPETMLGDGAVAVHPDDERYRPIVGKLCEIPVGPKAFRRLIPIITDDYPDPEFGSGAVKITGAHDENDYGVAQRNNIPMYRLMDEVAAMRLDGAPYAQAASRAQEIATGSMWTAAEIDTLNLVPDAYRGLDRYEARKRVVADIDADGLMICVEDKKIMQPFGDRGGVVIEPMLTDQWYVDAVTLAKPAIEAVRSGATKIVPKTWEKTYFNWMENIQPWCVSRQLWWGHRIPAWFCFNHVTLETEIFVTDSRDEFEKMASASNPEIREFIYFDSYREALEYSPANPISVSTCLVYRDPDVLDTWFSSALWPFATMGWPDQILPIHGEGDRSPQVSGGGGSQPAPDSPPAPSTTPLRDAVPLPTSGEDRRQLGGRYPNDVLISGFDILFFWDARMMMQGLHFMGEVPFKTLYLHGLVRAADGAKMSKSKGNTVDPLGLIDKYGADALRFFMAAMESQGRDIKMDEKRVEGYRNFATKLWNAARFCQANGIGGSATLEPPVATLAVNTWIIGETVKTVQALDLALAELRFDESATVIYQFVWNSFCDWYLELIKPVLSPSSSLLPGEGRGPDGEASHTGPRPSPGNEEGETRAVAGWVLDQILVMLHPFMPFVTEELWNALAPRPYELIVAKWPMPDARAIDPEASIEVVWLIELISSLRSARSEISVPPSARPALFVLGGDTVAGSIDPAHYPALLIERIEKHRNIISRLCRVDMVTFLNTGARFDLRTGVWESRLGEPPIIPGESASVVVGDDIFYIALEGVIDIAAERDRLTKAIAAAEKDRDSLAARLNNPSFVERAKPEAVEKARADHDDRASEAEKYRAALARLG